MPSSTPYWAWRSYGVRTTSCLMRSECPGPFIFFSHSLHCPLLDQLRPSYNQTKSQDSVATTWPVSRLKHILSRWTKSGAILFLYRENGGWKNSDQTVKQGSVDRMWTVILVQLLSDDTVTLFCSFNLHFISFQMIFHSTTHSSDRFICKYHPDTFKCKLFSLASMQSLIFV